MPIRALHHLAIIVSDIERSRTFYTSVLGCSVLRHTYREERQSHKLDLLLPGGVQLELFTFPSAPPRPTRPEAMGLRHLALAVSGLTDEVNRITTFGVKVEPIRTDEFTGQRYTFFADPDGLPIELYEDYNDR